MFLKPCIQLSSRSGDEEQRRRGVNVQMPSASEAAIGKTVFQSPNHSKREQRGFCFRWTDRHKPKDPALAAVVPDLLAEVAECDGNFLRICETGHVHQAIAYDASECIMLISC